MRALVQTGRRLVLAAALVLALGPLLWMVGTSVKSETEVQESRWALPSSPTFANYTTVWAAEGMRPSIVASIFITAVSVVALALLASLAGYAFSCFEFPYKTALWTLFLAGLLLPIHANLIPLLQLEGALGMAKGAGSLIFLLVVYVAFNLSFSTFFLRGFFEGVPRELRDAAGIDGCSHFGVYLRIMLPLSLPAMTVLALINFVFIWNEFIFALILLNSSTFSTVPLVVQQFTDGDKGLNIPVTCAAMVMAVVPPALVFLFAQKQIMRGMTGAASRG